MRRLLTLLIPCALLLTMSAPLSSADDDTFTCGEWWDVPDSQMEILTEVCEYGLMQGMSEDYYGYYHELTRAEAAVVGNRLINGSATYDEWGEGYGGYGTRLHMELEDYYSDLPEDSYENEWMLKAMYYASEPTQLMENEFIYGEPQGFMNGDGNGYPTTFRPNDSVNIVEMYKVLYESAKLAGVTSNWHHFDYEGDPWYEDILYYLEDEEAITDLDIDNQDIYLGDPIYKHFDAGFGEPLRREEAAQIMYFMIQSGLIDAEELTEHVYLTSLEDDPDFTVSDMYIEGDDLIIEIENLGTTDEDGLTFKFRITYDDGDYETITSSLTGNELFTYERENIDSLAEEEILVEVDPYDDWDEDDEDNNSMTLEL